MNNSHYDKIRADRKSIGFDYQYYYFLYKLLEIPKEGEIGLEWKDDVNIEFDGKLILVQLKHTTQKKGDSFPINLAEKDKDLWHTIHNWLLIIETEGGKLKNKQLSFIENTSFQLVTNKSYSSNNLFLDRLLEFQNKEIDINKFKFYLQNLNSNTTNSNIQTYISELLKVDNDILSNFLNKIFVETDFDNLIEKIFDRIQYRKSIEEQDIESVFNSLDSQLRRLNFENIKKGDRVIITGKEFYKQFNRCFNIGRSPRLPERKWNFYKFPVQPEKQVFIQQLVDIGDIEISDKKEIIKLTNHLLELKNKIKGWTNEGYITKNEADLLEDESIVEWDNEFRTVKQKSKKVNETWLWEHMPKIKDKKHKKIAIECVKALRKVKLELGTNEKTPLNTILSNGQFYYLSDENPKIGWVYNWENIY